MKRSTRFFLLAGCALVLCLEGPLTLSALAEGWRGPYPDGAASARSAALSRARPRPSRTLLALLPRR